MIVISVRPQCRMRLYLDPRAWSSCLVSKIHGDGKACILEAGLQVFAGLYPSRYVQYL
jgi:hypothetical protein